MSWLWFRKPSRNIRAPSKQAEAYDGDVYRHRTPRMKLAVFQVSEPGERTVLVCLEIRSLQAAAELEYWLQMNVGTKTDVRLDVRLLGRFDSVYFPSSEIGTENVVFGGEKQLQGPQP